MCLPGLFNSTAQCDLYSSPSGITCPASSYFGPQGFLSLPNMELHVLQLLYRAGTAAGASHRLQHRRQLLHGG